MGSRQAIYGAALSHQDLAVSSSEERKESLTSLKEGVYLYTGLDMIITKLGDFDRTTGNQRMVICE